MKKYSLFLTIAAIVLLSVQAEGRIFNLYPEGHPSYTTSIQQLIGGVSFGGHAVTDTLILHDGVYTENITLGSGDYNVCIMSENGYEYTTIVAASSSSHVISVNADNVTIQGLTVYGALSQGRSGIYISGSVDNITVKDNRVGHDASHLNYHGISVNGSQLYDYSHDITITGNICGYNYECGIYIQYSHNNYIADNILEHNSDPGSYGSYKSGIYLLYVYNSVIASNTSYHNQTYGMQLRACYNNTITGNVCNSNYEGIYVMNSSATNYISHNTCDGNTQRGIGFTSATNNYIFMNNLSSAINIAEYVGSSNTKNSPVKLHYLYGSSDFKNYMGNYFSNRGGNDDDGDGIGSTAIYGDSYPLWSIPSWYSLQTWLLNASGVMKEKDFGGRYSEITISPSGSYLWVSDKAAEADVLFTGDDSWEGQITFTAAPGSGHSLLVEVGYSSDGSGFTAAGPAITITGDGTNKRLTYSGSSGFAMITGDYLAVRVTNNSPSSYTVCGGGSFSMLSSPAGSDFLPVELTSFTANPVNNGVKLLWQTATETDNYGFEIERSFDNGSWNKIGFVKGAGNSNSPKSYSFIDNGLLKGKYLYRLKQVDTDGSYRYTEAADFINIAAGRFGLAQNYPNPFNPSTVIGYTLPENGMVTVKVYDALGREVQTLLNEYKAAGEYEIFFDAGELSSGLYFYKIAAGKNSVTKKMMLVR